MKDKIFTKAWLDYSLIEPEHLKGDGRPIKCDDGMLGFLSVWRTKKACKDAGHSTTSLKRVTLFNPTKVLKKINKKVSKKA